MGDTFDYKASLEKYGPEETAKFLAEQHGIDRDAYLKSNHTDEDFINEFGPKVLPAPQQTQEQPVGRSSDVSPVAGAAVGALAGIPVGGTIAGKYTLFDTAKSSMPLIKAYLESKKEKFAGAPKPSVEVINPSTGSAVSQVDEALTKGLSNEISQQTRTAQRAAAAEEAAKVAKGAGLNPSRPLIDFGNPYATKAGIIIEGDTARKLAEEGVLNRPPPLTKAQEEAKIVAEAQERARQYLASKGVAETAEATPVAKSLLNKTGDVAKFIGSPTGVGGKVLNTVLPVASLGAAGMDFADAYNRWQHGDRSRAVISALGGIGSAMTVIPTPLTRGVGTALSLGAPAINYAIDKTYGRSGYAQGGAVAPANYLAEGEQPEPTLGQAATNIYQGLTNPKQLAATGEALGRLRQSIPGVAESVVRGAVAAVPGVFGDIEELGRTGINAFQTNLGKLTGTNQGMVSPEAKLPTTRDILNYVPRMTPTHEGAQTLEDVGSFIGPGIGGLAKDTAMLTKGLPVGLSIQDVSKGRVFAPKNELGAYSALEEAALNLKQNKGTGDQLYNMLVKEPGVKQEEIQHRGLDALLKGNTEPVTKESILAHLQENPPHKITETKLGENYAGEREPDYDTAIDNFHNDWRNAELDDDAMNAEYNYRRYDDTDWHDQRRQEYKEEHGLDDEAFDADPAHQENVNEIIAQDAQASAEDYGPYVIRHRNHDYEIRGNNWGDIELHGPEGHIDNYRNIDEARQAAASHALDHGIIEPEYYDEGPGASQYHGYVGSGNGNYEEQLFHYENPGTRYDAPHFHDDNQNENLLMHMRRQDAENPLGQKLLKLEEQQSDWHQKGRDKGYHNPAMDQMVLDLNAEKIRALEDAKPWTDQGKDAPQEIQDRFTAADEKLQVLKRKLSSVVPDAPFKKNWNEFLMKKALHDAAVGGYDKLAWTTGKTQAQRYNKMLADNVSEIHYTKTPQGHYVIAFKRPGETSFTPYQNSIGEDALKDHFGEHIADQIKNNTGETIPYLTHHPEGTAALRDMGTSGYHFKTPGEMETFTGFGNSPEEAKADLIKTIPRLADKHIIKGENMSFGSGKGMQGFYDKMQADFLNKFAKKHGQKVHQDQVLGNMNPETVNALTITPEMRAELMERGFPMYKKGGIVKK